MQGPFRPFFSTKIEVAERGPARNFGGPDKPSEGEKKRQYKASDNCVSKATMRDKLAATNGCMWPMAVSIP